MFKYLKTAASDYHPAEIIEFFVNPGEEVKKGSLIFMEFDVIECEYSNNPNRPVFLAITGKGYDDAKYIKCIRVYENMVFEATIAPDEEKNFFFNGNACGILPDDTGKASYVTLEGAPVFEIVDASNKANGTVIVRKL